MEILEILKYTIPALIVTIVSFFLTKMYIDNEARKRNHELALRNKELTVPVRFQAYERIVLFLERISPESMLMRIQNPGMKSHELHKDLLIAIRAEFEHNLSQQIYISAKAWDKVKVAKTNLTKLINTTASQVDPRSPSLEFSKAILESIMEADIAPTTEAIDYLRAEVNKLF